MFLKRKNDSDVDLIVKKQHKIILIIFAVLILMLFMLLYFNVFGLFRVGGYYLAEDGQHFKVGTTVPTLHFQNLQGGITYRFQLWRPFDRPSGPIHTEITFSGPTYSYPINLYLDEDDAWNCDIHEWDSDFQEWFPVMNNGAIYSDSMCADIDITPFTVTPYSVEVDDVVEVQWTVRNTGDFNGMFDWHVCIDKNYNGICSSDYIESGEVPIDMNGAWGHTTSFIVDEDMANDVNVINVLLWVGFQGDDDQYPSEWYRMCSNNDNEERNEGIIFVPPDPPPLPSWTWLLPSGEWTSVTFTTEMLICVGSDAPENVFESVITVAGELWVVQEQDGQWKSWTNKEGGNTLEHILPNVECSIKAEYGCVLVIEKCSPDIDITLTVTTIPSNCEIFIAGVGTLNSGGSGVVVFEDVPYGYHNIVVSKSGYSTVTKTVFVDSDAVININLSQNFLLFLLILIIVVIAIAVIIYCYKKGIIRI